MKSNSAENLSRGFCNQVAIAHMLTVNICSLWRCRDALIRSWNTIPLLTCYRGNGLVWIFRHIQMMKLGHAGCCVCEARCAGRQRRGVGSWEEEKWGMTGMFSHVVVSSAEERAGRKRASRSIVRWRGGWLQASSLLIGLALTHHPFLTNGVSAQSYGEPCRTFK